MGCSNSKDEKTQKNGAEIPPPVVSEAGPSPPDPTVKTEDVEVTYKTIHSAVRWNKSVEEVGTLLTSKEMANIRDIGNGNFPLHIAAQNGHFDLVKLLLEREADVNCLNNKANTPLHMSLSYDYIEVSEYLMNKGADVNLENTSGQPTVRGWTATSGSLWCISERRRSRRICWRPSECVVTPWKTSTRTGLFLWDVGKKELWGLRLGRPRCKKNLKH